MGYHGVTEERSETAPLLGLDTEAATQEPTKPRPTWWQSWERVVLGIFAIVLLVSCGDQWQDIPHARIMEAVLCYRHFEQADPSKLLLDRDHVGPGAIGGVAELYCKVDEVQSQLAMLRGWQSTFDGLPTLLLALPVGWAADRYGRKPFLLAGLLGYVLKSAWTQMVLWFWQSLSVKAVWFSTLFGAVGGGNSVTVTLLFVILSDVAPEGKRANAFLRVGAFNILAALVMPPFAAWLMRYNPWIPAFGGTSLMIIGMVLFLVFPETQYFHGRPPVDECINEARLQSAGSESRHKDPGRLAHWVRHSLIKLKDESAFFFNDWRIPALTLPFLLHMLLGAVSALLLQYLSKRYGLTFADATMVMIIRSAVLVLLLFVILPSVSNTLMQRFHLSGPRKDLYLVRSSLVLIIVGWTVIGLSPNLPTVTVGLAIASLGQGYPLLLRSFLTALVPSHHIARMYSIVSIIDTLGMMVGSPMLAGLFKRGLSLGGAWIGLPFYFTSLCALASLLLVLSIRLRKSEEESPVVDEEQ